MLGLERGGLNERQFRFVECYLRHGIGRKAAIEAGYPKAGASNVAGRLMKDERIKAMIEEARKQVIDSGAYGLVQAMRECDDAIAFAVQTKNANARVKAVELKVDKTEVRMLA